MRNPNQLSPVRKTIAAGMVVVLGAVGCAPSRSTSETSISQSPVSKITTWTGDNPQDVPYPGRIALPQNTCTQWGVNNPQPTVKKDGELLAIVDARRSIPVQCDYLTDIGSGTYAGASYDSGPKQRPDGTRHTPDGTVVSLEAYSLGQFACNSGGGSNLWLEYEETPGGPNFWAPVINLGGSPTRSELDQASVPQIPSPYAGTVLPSC